MNKLMIADAAYMAGLIDADGTVTLTRRHRNENRHAAVSISNTDRALLQFVLATVGAGKVTEKRIVRPSHNPSFTYAVYNRQAVNLLAQVQRFLETYKFRRAELILRDYVSLTLRNGKYTKELRAALRKFEQEVLGTRPRDNSPEHRQKNID